MSITSKQCVFCEIAKHALDSSIVYEDDDFLIVMDLYPLSDGHLLVIPKQHQQYLHDLTEKEQIRIFELGNAALQALRASGYGLGGCNLLLNDGKDANQTVPHVHLHVIPRKRYDILRSLPKLILHITGVFGIQKKRAILDEQAKTIAANINV